MKNIILIYTILLLVLITSCSKEEELTPSRMDINFFARIDNPKSELEHLIYEVYVETGIPILYSDTVNKISLGYGLDGKEYFEYEILDLDYRLEGKINRAKKISYSYIKEEADIIEGVKFLRNYVLPRIPNKIFVNSYFLVDSLYKDNTPEAPLNSDIGFAALVLGNIPEIKGMTDSEKIVYSSYALKFVFTNYIIENFPEDIIKFKAFSFDEETQIDLYDKNCGINTTKPSSYSLPGKIPVEEMGFLEKVPNPEVNKVNPHRTPTLDIDISSFVQKIIEYGPSGFEEQYKQYPLVIEKYKIIKKILLDNIEFEL